MPNRTNTPSAISDFIKAVEINPNYADAYYNRAITYDQLEQYDPAIKYFSKTIEIIRNTPRRIMAEAPPILNWEIIMKPDPTSTKLCNFNRKTPGVFQQGHCQCKFKEKRGRKKGPAKGGGVGSNLER